MLENCEPLKMQGLRTVCSISSRKSSNFSGRAGRKILAGNNFPLRPEKKKRSNRGWWLSLFLRGVSSTKLVLL